MLSAALVREDRSQPARNAQLGERWMDAMGVDHFCLFTTGILSIGLHPHKEMELELCWAYHPWVTEVALPATTYRMFTMPCQPFCDPEGSLHCIETLATARVWAAGW